MDILINAANVLYVIAYFTTDMLRLRVLTLVAAACLATYFASQPVPLWTVVGWNLFFFALNAGQLTRLLLPRWREKRAAAQRSVAARERVVDGARATDVLGGVDGAHDAATGDVDRRDARSATDDADVPPLRLGDAPGHAGLRGRDHRLLVLDEHVVGDKLLVVGGRWIDSP
jgi:hypothetical protein